MVSAEEGRPHVIITGLCHSSLTGRGMAGSWDQSRITFDKIELEAAGVRGARRWCDGILDP